MTERASDILGFAPEALWVTLGVLVAVGIIVKLVFDLIIKGRELRKTKVSDEKTIRDKLRSDHERLCALESTTKKQDEELKLILRSNVAIIHHMIDGNNTDTLKSVQSDIENYLIYGNAEKKGE